MKYLITVIMLLFIFSCQQERLKKIDLTDDTYIVFADSSKSAEIVTQADDYSEMLSTYDRSAGMLTDKPVTKEQYNAHLAKNVRGWDSVQVARFTQIVNDLPVKLNTLKLDLPQEIFLIKTTSQEVGGVSVAYTRQNAIMFTPQTLNEKDDRLEDILIHEIFHVYSRHNLDKRNALYNIIGFSQSNDIKLPTEWDERRITNPDAPTMNTIIELESDDSLITVTPLTFAQNPIYDTSKPGGIFQSFSFQLMEVKKENNKWLPRILGGNPVLHSPRDLQDFWKKIGRNTNYIIHPEEIMASNFVHLIKDKKDLPNPEIIEKMRKVLQPW